MKSKVLVLKSDGAAIYSDIVKVFDFYPHVLERKPKKIAIKLNIGVIKPPESGAIADPIFVENLLRVLREKCGPEPEIAIIEANSTNNRNVSICYKIMGFEAIAEKYGAKCVNLSDEPVVKKKIDGYLFKEIEVPKIMTETDLLITLPKLKTHYLAKITGGLKNQFGCYPTKDKYKFHDKLSQAIVDANLMRKPDFALLDAINCMVGPGSLAGMTKKCNLIIASDDVVAADCVGAKLFGFNPRFVGHIRKAAAKGLGSTKYSLHGDLKEITPVDAEFDRFTFYVLEKLRNFGRKIMN